jgi:hypothetical protein
MDAERNDGCLNWNLESIIPDRRTCSCPGKAEDGLMGSLRGRDRSIVDWNLEVIFRKKGRLFDGDIR